MVSSRTSRTSRSSRALISPCQAFENSLLMSLLPPYSAPVGLESILLKTGGRNPCEKLALRCQLGAKFHTSEPENSASGSYGRSPKPPCTRTPPSSMSAGKIRHWSDRKPAATSRLEGKEKKVGHCGRQAVVPG